MKNTEITAYADAYGRWAAEVSFPHTLSESDPRPEFNINHQLPGIRRQARTAIVRELTEREQKTTESWQEAAARVRASLPNLKVLTQNIDSMNRWHGITLGE